MKKKANVNFYSISFKRCNPSRVPYPLCRLKVSEVIQRKLSKIVSCVLLHLTGEFSVQRFLFFIYLAFTETMGKLEATGSYIDFLQLLVSLMAFASTFSFY